jgi:hypothetical protein
MLPSNLLKKLPAGTLLIILEPDVAIEPIKAAVPCSGLHWMLLSKPNLKPVYRTLFTPKTMSDC